MYIRAKNIFGKETRFGHFKTVEEAAEAIRKGYDEEYRDHRNFLLGWDCFMDTIEDESMNRVELVKKTLFGEKVVANLSNLVKINRDFYYNH